LIISKRLEKVEAGQLDERSKKLEKVLSFARSHLRTFTQLRPGSPVVDDPASMEIIKASKSALLRARVTKLEVYIMKILIKSPSEKKHILRYTAEFAQASKSCFSLHVRPDIVALCAAEDVRGAGTPAVPAVEVAVVVADPD
jgi:hypothetical protein